MRKIFFILIICIAALRVAAQPEPCDQNGTDPEQQQLELCYRFSNIFGYTIDTISNLKLFELISEWLGTDYCYGGDTKNGVDCSGFVNVLYKKVYNTELEGSSKDIYKNVKPLKKSQLHEGDMVFFKIRKKRVSHVGVYIGNNKFVHASVHEGVTISDLDEPYYKKYFYKGGRVKS